MLLYCRSAAGAKILSDTRKRKNHGVQVKKEMDKRKTEKITCLAVAVIVLAMSLLHVADWHTVGIYPHCPFYCRLTYSFFHANILHAVLNCWCLVAVMFIYDITIPRLITAFVIAASYPVGITHAVQPTIGLSAIIYALFGSISFSVEHKLKYQLWMLFYVLLGFAMPQTNALIHLYCYLCGFIVALLNKPIKIKR